MRRLLGHWVMIVATLATVVATAPQAAAADEGDNKSRDTWSIGARTGTYAFRQTEGGQTNWEGSRMNGAGIFHITHLSRHVFFELSLDYYEAGPELVERGLDRQSVITQGAFGVQMFPGSFLSPHIEAGFGPEWTRIEIGDVSDVVLAPTAFTGLGAEVKLGGLRIGADARLAMMAVPVRSLEPDVQIAISPDGPRHVETTMDAATQFTAYARYAW